MPIIIVTGSDDEEDIIRCLEAGANDYMTKPFRTDELLARVRAHLRVFESSDDASHSRWSLGVFTLQRSCYTT